MSSMSSPAPPRPSRPQQQPASFTTEDHYFSSNPPPAALAAHVAQAKAFIDAHARAHRRVVLVTSGGTTVPLERQTVRYIDNFSAGTRGATSAEYFLETGAYAVIFLHRQFSLLPYSRHYTHATDCFLDFLHEAAAPPGTGTATSSSSDGREGTTGGSIVVAKDEYRDKMLRVLRKYSQARADNLLLMIPFVTITDYLHELRALARLMQPLGGDALLYLAAAVSDFFVPPERMAEHKIQSTDAADAIGKGNPQSRTTTTPGSSGGSIEAPAGTPTKSSSSSDLEGEETFDNFDSSPLVPRSKRLVIDLDPVPKFLKNLVDGWAPGACIVSFKLETDPAILVHKARYSLDRYQHHLVIGNLLATRKWEVVFVSPGLPDRWIRVPLGRRKKSSAGQEHLVGAADRGWNAAGGGEGDRPLDPSTLPEGEPEMEIESLIIGAVEDLHSRHIDALKERVKG